MKWSRAFACLLCTSCGIEELDVELSEQGVEVAWTNAVGVAVDTNSLTKTAGAGWGNGGASSTMQISGDAFVELTTDERNRGKSAGLSTGDANQDHTDIDFSIHLSGNGSFYVYEAGVLAGQFGTYAVSDVFRVQSVERVVSYLRNGVPFYTSTRLPQYPLLVDTALFHPGATLREVRADAFAFTAVTGATATASLILKTAPDGTNNGGAISVRQIREGDGYVQFTTLESNRTKTAGLSLADPDQREATIRWGIRLTAARQVQVVELGALRGTFGLYNPGDVFRVAVVGGQIRYSKNGTVFYTSISQPSYPMFFDSSLFTTKATLANIVLEDTFWTSVAGADAIGGKLINVAATGWGNAGAVSLGSIAAGTGHVEFSTNEVNRAKALGLSHTSETNSYTDIDYAITLGAAGQLVVFENGATRGTFGTYARTDTFRVAVNATGQVEYRRNGAVFYTSTVAPVYPLFADAALFSTGATLTGVSIVDSP
jgi:hypothetical protein